MNILSRNKVLAAGTALILLTNIYVIAGALWNRAGEPDAALDLSERELTLRDWNLNENSGLTLALNWNGYYDLYNSGIQDKDRWLDAEKLQELGFELIPTDDPARAWKYTSKQLPRQVWIVLEFDGPAYQAALKAAEEKAREEERLLGNDASSSTQAYRLEDAGNQLLWLQHTASRLYAVDAGLDPSQLRQRYPDRSRYIVASGLVRIGYDDRDGGRITGYITEISVTAIHVPLAHRAVFDTLPPLEYIGDSTSYYPRAYHPRYQVKLAYGRRYEPWIMGVAAIRGQGNDQR